MYKDSPLRYHINAGDIITALDDTSLARNVTESSSSWDGYLLSPVSKPLDQGWCMSSSQYESRLFSYVLLPHN